MGIMPSASASHVRKQSIPWPGGEMSNMYCALVAKISCLAKLARGPIVATADSGDERSCLQIARRTGLSPSN
eukprot:scaffold138369_cov115-Phaeocystis_antarctica.AAC.1